MTEKPETKNVSSRQNIRKWILILSFILIPVTIFYISPIIVMMGAGEGVASGSLLLYIALFLLSLVVARLWCGWLCPMGAWQEICSPVIKGTVKEGWRNWIKYGVTILWLGMIAFTFSQAGGIRSVDPFYGTVNGISISSVQVLMMVGMIFAFIFIIAFLTGKRGTCHVFCPIAGIMVAGRKIRNLFHWPALGLSADSSLCIDCKKCSKECPMGLDVNGMVRKDEMENADCILCASCADACPKGAIRYGWSRK
ncbi:4Fe-4S binding protein [Methanoregula sp.]|uniref:4Fe-4S binding protein n=1 Tax=Methanoregula sp. TaxID=2052170 RepID=UPI000CC342BC|nr:4Fe-4S dicluster domain-containing protein [Methanoregula sp.]PKG31935.1 MAG: 4Fe-4S ferredoxin [Methanoregula sp.]